MTEHIALVNISTIIFEMTRARDASDRIIGQLATAVATNKGVIDDKKTRKTNSSVRFSDRIT